MSRLTIKAGTAIEYKNGEEITENIYWQNVDELMKEFEKQKSQFKNPNVTEDDIMRVAEKSQDAKRIQKLGQYEDIDENPKHLADIKKAFTDYQEIAKRYNWDDITNEIFNVKTDKKYRDLFSGAIVNIQEDYRKARALEIIKNKGVFIHLLQQSKNVEEYNSFMLIAFKKMAERDYKGAVEKFCLTQKEFDFLKKELL